LAHASTKSLQGDLVKFRAFLPLVSLCGKQESLATERKKGEKRHVRACSTPKGAFAARLARILFTPSAFDGFSAGRWTRSPKARYIHENR
jgi:hypothetical protein